MTGAPDESGSKRRQKGLAKAGNARVRRGLIQLAWRFLRRGNQPGNSVNLEGSVARGVTEGGRSPTGGTFLATARTHIG
ncbi:hypothetical protein D3227_41020, partial [Mesorhizobium waimense]